MWPCCDFTSSDDDEHNTDNNFLLLLADTITPTLLEGLSEIDVLHIALGCRFALDIFAISQPLSPTPDPEPLPYDPEFATFLSMGAKLVPLVNLLGPRSLQFPSTMGAPGGDVNLAHSLSLRDTGTCATRSRILC